MSTEPTKNDNIIAAVHVLASEFVPNIGFYGDTMQSLACSEADALAELFRVAGYADFADYIIEDHHYGDYPEDAHYVEGESRED